MSEPEGMRAVLVLGSRHVGKTWFINRFRDPRPDDDEPEALDNFPSKNVEIDGCPWRLMIIERSEEQDEEAWTWIPLVEAIILMYSVDDQESFKQLENYVNLINESNTRNLRATVVVGSKADVPPECRRVSPEQLLKFSFCHKMPCFEVSSLQNHRITDVLLEITGKMKMQQHEILMRQRLRELTCKIVVVGACAVGKTVYCDLPPVTDLFNRSSDLPCIRNIEEKREITKERKRDQSPIAHIAIDDVIVHDGTATEKQ